MLLVPSSECASGVSGDGADAACVCEAEAPWLLLEVKPCPRILLVRI